MRKRYVVRIEMWTTRLLNNGERHLGHRVMNIETRFDSFEDALVGFARIDAGACWIRRGDSSLAVLKTIWHEGACVAFDSFDIEDHRRQLALEDLGEQELEEVELSFGRVVPCGSAAPSRA